MTRPDSYNLPDDLTDVSSALDRLGESDARRDGLEERVFDASRASLPTPPTYRLEQPARSASGALSRFAPLRLAASVALIGGLIVVFMAARTPNAPTTTVELASLEETMDDWMELSSVFEGELAGDIDTLGSAAQSLDLDDWSFEFVGDDEGSM